MQLRIMRNNSNITRLLIAALLAGLAAMFAHATVGIGGHGLDDAFNDWLYNALMLGSAVMVLARAALVRRQRSTWLAMGAGVMFWSLGELYYSIFIEGTSAEAVGSISPADGLFLAMYPCFYVGLGHLAKDRLKRLPVGVWLDGVIAGLAAATVAATLVLPPIIDHARGDVGSTIVSSAYPLGDLLLLLFAVGALGVSGWRPGRVWTMIAASMLVSAVADSLYLYQTATGSFQEGTWVSCLWPAGAILVAIAAWTPYRQPKARAMRGWEAMSSPMVGLVSAVGVLTYGNLAHRLPAAVLALALITLVTVGAHLILTMRENLDLLASSQRLSLTDPLTGLGNRRRLIADLHLACASARENSPWELVLYDLDGFKRYNDAFGHPAGDGLLTRLSTRLARAVEPAGTAYRMGGDEFCVLFQRDGTDGEALAARGVRALSEQGPGFTVTASYGAVTMPVEACDPSAVVQLADQRLYRHKEEQAAARFGGVAEELTIGSSADAEDGQHALASWQADGDLLPDASPEERPGDGGFGGDAPLGGRSVV